MKTYFIETRLGEPLTAIDHSQDFIAFGSISGYYGILNTVTNNV